MRKFLSLFVVMPLVGVGCLGVNQQVAPVESSEATIEYRDGVFSPAQVRIGIGTTVTFKNVGTRSVWPASDAHPSHLLCPGFDSRAALEPGESYSYTFTTAQVCPFHNHLSATEVGRIVIE